MTRYGYSDHLLQHLVPSNSVIGNRNNSSVIHQPKEQLVFLHVAPVCGLIDRILDLTSNTICMELMQSAILEMHSNVRCLLAVDGNTVARSMVSLH
jgi:hypothetical protein